MRNRLRGTQRCRGTQKSVPSCWTQGSIRTWQSILPSERSDGEMRLVRRPAKLGSRRRRSRHDAALGSGTTGTFLPLETEGALPAMIAMTSGATWMLRAADWIRQTRRHGHPARTAATHRDQTATVMTDGHLINTLPSRDPRCPNTSLPSATHTTAVLSVHLLVQQRSSPPSPTTNHSQRLRGRTRTLSTQHTTHHHRPDSPRPQTYHRNRWTERSATPSGRPPTLRTALLFDRFSCQTGYVTISSLLPHKTLGRASRCAAYCAEHQSTMPCSSAAS